MSTFREKAQGRTRQMVGEMIGDQKLIEEGKEQVHKAEAEEAEQQAYASENRSEPPPAQR